MAWEISHSPISWILVRANLRAWRKGWLVSALCDVQYIEAERADTEYDQDTYKSTIIGLDTETLVDLCLDAIEKHNTCSNGGHEFYIDPEGYHTVPVSLTDEAKELLTDEERVEIEVYAPEELEL